MADKNYSKLDELRFDDKKFNMTPYSDLDPPVEHETVDGWKLPPDYVIVRKEKLPSNTGAIACSVLNMICCCFPLAIVAMIFAGKSPLINRFNGHIGLN